jgi:hypothetical protein
MTGPEILNFSLSGFVGFDIRISGGLGDGYLNKMICDAS